MGFKIRPLTKPKPDKKLKKELEGLATHEDIAKIEVMLKDEKKRLIVSLLTPKQKAKMLRILLKQMRDKDAKEQQ